ncbi:MAG TPA: glycosyltransferase family 39 protein [Candidatus Eremiobacteraceae bacterium]|nr:glycosyltransferase family 39 protein [Candidatus Eremiobacteraceae bacterium]
MSTTAGSRYTFPIAAALFTFILHALGNPHYGFFRDELYFIMCGRHPDWGYVDQPPVVPLLGAASQALGTSLILLRLVPAFFAAASVYVTCTLAQELGGALFAQIVAAVAACLAPVLMGLGSQLDPDGVGLWLWPLAALFIVRMVKGECPRLWLAVGALFGVCFESKYSVAYFIAALIVAMLLTGERRLLWSKWFAGGVALAALIALANFLWQAAHGFPIVELLRNGQLGKNVMLTPLEFIGQQFVLMNPVLSLVWLAGLVWLLLKPAYRFLGLTYVILMLLMAASHAKSYYPADAYPILIAAGGAAIESWTERARLARPLAAAVFVLAGAVFVPFAMPVLPEQSFIAYSNSVYRALGADQSAMKTENHALGSLPQDYADMHGWPELAATVAHVYDELPPADRAKAVAFAQNYGEAAAIEFFAPRVPVVSGHNQYWLWGPRGHDGSVVIDVAGDCGAKQHLFASGVKAATFSAPYVMPYEDGIPIMVCRGLKIPIATLWLSLKHYE